jgi:hypothetical protein
MNGGREIRLPHISPSSRRVVGGGSKGSSLGRKFTFLVFLVIAFISFDGIFTHKLVGHDKVDPLAVEQLEVVDQELIKVLVKTKQAMEQRTPVEDLAGFADRVMVLSVSSRCRWSLRERVDHPLLSSPLFSRFNRNSIRSVTNSTLLIPISTPRRKHCTLAHSNTTILPCSVTCSLIFENLVKSLVLSVNYVHFTKYPKASSYHAVTINSFTQFI